MSIPANTAPFDWILAITTIAFVFASAGNGANDVANSYATSVAARTLTMPQAGVLAVITEFVGAVALGARVTSTIKVILSWKHRSLCIAFLTTLRTASSLSIASKAALPYSCLP